jgi:hypothetical protein
MQTRIDLVSRRRLRCVGLAVEGLDLAAALGGGSAVAEPERQAVEVGSEPEQLDLAASAWRRAASSSLQKVQARRSGLPARAASRRPTATPAASSAVTIPPETNRSAILPPPRRAVTVGALLDQAFLI